MEIGKAVVLKIVSHQSFIHVREEIYLALKISVKILAVDLGSNSEHRGH